MIIRSQNKKNITNFAQVTDLSVEELRSDKSKFSISVYYPFSLEEEYSKMSLGEYSTEEKAIKVLDMIQEKYAISEKAKIRGLSADFVFEMPQDDCVVDKWEG